MADKGASKFVIYIKFQRIWREIISYDDTKENKLNLFIEDLENHNINNDDQLAGLIFYLEVYRKHPLDGDEHVLSSVNGLIKAKNETFISAINDMYDSLYMKPF